MGRYQKDKGYSQETLAEALGVVRQTVSKWEKGLSVPDADLLEKMAELLEVDVNTLLGASLPSESERNSLDEIVKQLAVFNERSASNINKRRMIKKIPVYRTGRIYRHHFSYDHIGTVIQSQYER